MAGSPELDPSRGTKRYWEGVWHYFCDLVCRSKFDSRPSEYMTTRKGGSRTALT